MSFPFLEQFYCQLSLLPNRKLWPHWLNKTCFITCVFIYIIYRFFSISLDKTSRYCGHTYSTHSTIQQEITRVRRRRNQENVGEIKKKSVLTPRNVRREKQNTVIYYKTPPKHRHRRLDAAKQDQIKKWDINLYLYVLEICI